MKRAAPTKGKKEKKAKVTMISYIQEGARLLDMSKNNTKDREMAAKLPCTITKVSPLAHFFL
jgi:hypothetical protein